MALSHVITQAIEARGLTQADVTDEERALLGRWIAQGARVESP